MILHNAAIRGHVDVVRYLCELPPDRRVDPSAHQNCAIRHAARLGKADVVQYLCGLPRDRGVDPSTLHNYSIRRAAWLGHVDVVRYLCELPPDRGVDPSTLNSGAIHTAANQGHVDVVRYVLNLPPERGVAPPPFGATSLTFDVRTARYLSWLVKLWHRRQSARVASGRSTHSLTTFREFTWCNLDASYHRYGRMVERMSARLPVLALRALVREPNHRGRASG